MATYRLSVYVAKRSEGRSATAMAAYRACDVVPDLRTGEQHDFRRKSGLLYSEIVTPENAPEWARNRAELWNRSEAAHKRGDAVIAREMQLSLPHELDAVQRRELAVEFAQHIADRYKIAVDTNLHAPDPRGDNRNYHAHLMLCTRPFDEGKPQGLGNNVRVLDAISHQKAGTKNHVTQWRETWENMLNRALQRANIRDADGVQIEVSHKSYKEREMDLEPQLKEGPAATAKKRRGEETDRSQINDEIKTRNAERLDIAELRRRQAQQILAQDARDLLTETPRVQHPMPRQAKDLTAQQANDNLRVPNLQRRIWENDEQYQARCQAAFEYTKEHPESTQQRDRRHYER